MAEFERVVEIAQDADAATLQRILEAAIGIAAIAEDQFEKRFPDQHLLWLASLEEE